MGSPARRHGPRAALHDALIEAAVTDAGGRVLKARGEGDSTFAVFERPTGAIRAALRECGPVPADLLLTRVNDLERTHCAADAVDRSPAAET